MLYLVQVEKENWKVWFNFVSSCDRYVSAGTLTSDRYTTDRIRGDISASILVSAVADLE